MKRIIILLLCCVLTLPARSQSWTNTVYEKKSEPFFRQKNKTLGIVLLAGGTAVAVAGLALNSALDEPYSVDTFSSVMILGGSAAAITGIILLASANDHKEESRYSWHLDLGMEKKLIPDTYGYQLFLKTCSYPVVSFKMSL